jgi:hypothetical protein
MGNVAETMQKNLIGPATSFVADPLAGLGVGGKKEAFVAKVGEPLTFVELWVRQWVDVFDKKHGTWCVAKIARWLASLRRVTQHLSAQFARRHARPFVCVFLIH